MSKKNYRLLQIILIFFFGVSAGTLAELKTAIANGDDVTNFDTSGITDMNSLFEGLQHLIKTSKTGM